MKREVVILAAGHGSRLHSRTSKALQSLAGRPLIQHVEAVARAVEPDRLHVVIAPGAEDVRGALSGQNLSWTIQPRPLGTGHAVRCLLPRVDSNAILLVTCVDMPLVRPASLNRCLEQAADGLSVLTAEVENPGSLGRIVRGESGEVLEIVEARDANDDQLGIREVNTGVMAAPASVMARLLPKLPSHDSTGEIYLTDLVASVRQEGLTVSAVRCEHSDEAMGANTRAEIAALERLLREQRSRELMAAGVAIADPSRLDVRGSVKAGADCWIDVNVVLEGRVEMGHGVSLGPGCVLRDVSMESGVVVHPYSVIEGASIGESTEIGPFARIRPSTEIGRDSRVGNFVELKNARLGSGVKAGHLAYVGDATAGAGSNIGAGAVTCNYDGKRKHQTRIGKRVFVGTNATLVAPLSIDDDAFVAAGSTITKPVRASELAVARSRQKAYQGWTPPKDRD